MFSPQRSELPCPFHANLSIGVLLNQFMFKHSCWWYFIGIASNISRGNSRIANPLFLWLLYSVCLLFHNDLRALGGDFVVESVGTGIHNFTSRLAVVLCSGLHLLQRGIFLVRGEDYNYLFTGKFLEYSQGPCWFSKGVAVGFPFKIHVFINPKYLIGFLVPGTIFSLFEGARLENCWFPPLNP